MSKKEKSAEDFQDFLLAKMNQKAPRSAEWGTYEISRSNKKILSKIKYVLTTGIPTFDDVAGGFPFGRIVELFGLEGCGKTAMAIRTAARARAGCISEVLRSEDGTLTYRSLDPDEYEVAVLYIDNEGSLDEDNKIVVDGQPLDILTGRCDTIEGVFKMTDDFLDGAEVKTELDDTASEKAGKKAKLKFLVIVVDTVASTSSREELALAWGKRDFPRVPGEISKGFNRIVRRLNINNACMICTNQVRTKFQAGGQPGRGSATPQSYQFQSLGGFALRFYASHRIFMQASQAKYKLLPDAKFPAGLSISFHTVKNRLRPPLRDGRMVLLFDKKNGGFNEQFSLLENLTYTGFIDVVNREKSTDFICKFNKNGIIPTTFGDAQVKTTLDEDDSAPTPRRSSRKDPGFKFRAEWPKFYQEHKADIDRLWQAAVEYTFNTPGLDGVVLDDNDLEEAHEED
jgi:RecA/RadA recombinase